jgi:Component of IIS longevity pathway SMK-1
MIFRFREMINQIQGKDPNAPPNHGGNDGGYHTATEGANGLE